MTAVFGAAMVEMDKTKPVIEMEQGRSLRPFLILWSGQAVSLFGSQIVQFALIWWLTQETGSATILALASVAGLVPQVILGPFAGVLVDRWSRRWTMFVADSVVAAASLLLAFLFWADLVQVWHIFALLFVRALGGAFHWPAMQASMSLMVPEDKLTRVQGWNQMLQGGLNIVSAPLGAVLLGIFTMPLIMGIDVVTAVFAILPLLFIPVPQPPETPDTHSAPQQKASFREDLRLGLRYVWSWPGLMMIMGMAALINFLLTPTASLQPLLVTEHFGGGAVQLGFLESSFGIGILIGGIVLSAWGGFKRRVHTTLLALIGLGAGILLLGLTPATAFWFALVAGFIVGSMMSLTNGPVMAIVQTAVEPAMQGRVFTLLGSMAMAMSPLGLIVAGPLADLLGIRMWYILGGTVTILVGISGFFNRPLLAVEDGRQPDSSSENTPPVSLNS